MKTIYDDCSGHKLRLYQFDEKTGILYVAFESNDLERFIGEVADKYPQFHKEKVNLELSTRWYGERVTFEGVKEIKSIPDLTKEEKDYFAYH